MLWECTLNDAGEDETPARAVLVRKTTYDTRTVLDNSIWHGYRIQLLSIREGFDKNKHW